MAVYCIQDVSPQPQTRVVEFYACPTGRRRSAAQTSGVCPLRARVAYNDLNAQGVDDCYTPPSAAPVTTSCGLAMNVQLWDVTGADN